MVVVEILQWWYGRGYRHLGRSLGERMRLLALGFSAPLLIQTLFSPWKRVITYGNNSIGDRMRALLDNAISRLVGFTVRMLTLLAAGISLLVIGMISGIAILVWPLLPPLAIVLLIVGLVPW